MRVLGNHNTIDETNDKILFGFKVTKNLSEKVFI